MLYTLCDFHHTEHRRSWCKRSGAVDVIVSVDGRASKPKVDPRVVGDGGELLKGIGEQKREPEAGNVNELSESTDSPLGRLPSR